MALPHLIQMFGKAGNYYFNIARGIDNRLVKPDRKAKSVSVENTFREDLFDINTVQEQISKLCETLCNRIENRHYQFKTVVIKVRYQDFETITRNRSLPLHSSHLLNIKNLALELINELDTVPKGIRLLGVGICNFQEESLAEPLQLTFGF